MVSFSTAYLSSLQRSQALDRWDWRACSVDPHLECWRCHKIHLRLLSKLLASSVHDGEKQKKQKIKSQGLHPSSLRLIDSLGLKTVQVPTLHGCEVMVNFKCTVMCVLTNVFTCVTTTITFCPQSPMYPFAINSPLYLSRPQGNTDLLFVPIDYFHL